MELFEKLEGLPGRRRPAIPCKLGWIRAFRPGPAVPWWDSTGPDSTENPLPGATFRARAAVLTPPSARNRGIFDPYKLLKTFTVAETGQTDRNRSRKK